MMRQVLKIDCNAVYSGLNLNKTKNKNEKTQMDKHDSAEHSLNFISWETLSLHTNSYEVRRISARNQP